jgi:hypothetical protein
MLNGGINMYDLTTIRNINGSIVIAETAANRQREQREEPERK